MLRHFKTGTKVVGLVLVAAFFMAAVVANVWKERGEGEAELRQLEVQVLPLFDASQENVERLKDLWVVFERAVLLVAAPETDIAARRELEALRDHLAELAASGGSVDAMKLLDEAAALAHNEGEAPAVSPDPDLA